MMMKSLLVVLVPSMAFLAACSAETDPAKPSVDVKPAEVSVVEETAAVVEEVSASIVSEKFITGNFDVPTGPFTASLVLKSDNAEIEPQLSYSPTYPPMPAIIDSLRIFQLDDGYRFYAPSIDVDVRAGTAASDTRVVLGQTGNTYRLSVNGAEIASGEGELMNGGKMRFYSDGKGRNWDGTISEFKITSDAGVVYPLNVAAQD